MRTKLKNKKWYSIIVIIIIIWFLIVLTSWVFRLIMNELSDNRTLWNYIKTYSWAETAQELSLFDIKNIWYWTIKNIIKSDMLNPFSNTAKDVKISFYNDWRVNEYTWKIQAWQTDMLPLFYLDENGEEQKTREISIKVLNWNSEDISWNIVWEREWISWDGKDFSKWAYKTIKSNWSEANFSYTNNKLVNEFLWNSNQNYLILYNAWLEIVEYEIKSSQSFTKPELTIISSWEVPKYKTNIETKVNLSEMFNRSKYSIFSP